MPGQDRDIRILPGIAQRDPKAPDVMRGEETQLLGALGVDAADDAVVCMPGTHSKWVRANGGTVERFATFMTGELFDVVSRETILSHAVTGADEAEDIDAFRSAVMAAFETPAFAANLLFQVRSGQLLYGGKPSSAREKISGTLIGLELAAGLAGRQYPAPASRWWRQGGSRCFTNWRLTRCPFLSDQSVPRMRSVAAFRWPLNRFGTMRIRRMSVVPFPPMKRPLVAILRGVKPEEAEDIVSVLIDSGMTAIEIPLNSPDPFRSIEIAVKKAPAGILVGAGTVLTLEAVERLHDVGGRLLVTPNVDPDIIARARARGMVTMPGVFTPTEALLAAKAGASSLKFFPASVLGAAGITAIRAVLPADLMIAAVGGVSDKNFADYTRAGILAFGLGSSLYKPGMTAAEVAVRAKATIDAYDMAIRQAG